jgi:hypothetical protein
MSDLLESDAGKFRWSMSTLARFTGRMVSLGKKALIGAPEPAREGGRRLRRLGDRRDSSSSRVPRSPVLTANVLSEIRRICRILRLDPGFSRFYNRFDAYAGPQNEGVSRALERSAKLHDTVEIQATDATGMDRIAASHHYAKTDELHVSSGEYDRFDRLQEWCDSIYTLLNETTARFPCWVAIAQTKSRKID